MPRHSSQNCEQKQWQPPPSNLPRKSSRSCSHQTNRSKDQRKRLENAITKYRKAARTAEYGSKDNTELSLAYKETSCHNGHNSRRNTSERKECKNNLERNMSGGFHFHYKDVPPCDDKSSRCNSQTKHNHSKCRKSIDEVHPCQGSKRLTSSNQREYCTANHNKNGSSGKSTTKNVEKCMCLDKSKEKEKSVSSKEREQFPNKYKLRETSDEKRQNQRHRNSTRESQRSTCSYKPKSPKKCHRDRMSDTCHEDEGQYYKKFNKDFEKNFQKLSTGVTNKDCRQRKLEESNQRRLERHEDCKQRKREDEQSDETCPIQIRLTARFTPVCINDQDTTPTETHRDEDTCCSCCSDDEDSFYTPDNFTASLRDMRGLPRPCHEESKSDDSSESTSNNTGNEESCPPNGSHHYLARDEERPVEYFDKDAKIEETKEQLRRSGFCKYILSPFGSNTTLEDNKCSKNTVIHKHCDCIHNHQPEPINLKETEMYNAFCKEIQTLKEEVDRIKCSHQEKQSFSRSEVDCLVKENQSLKKELDEFKENVEEQFQKMLEEKLKIKAQNKEICHKNGGIGSSCGDKSELSQGYNEVLDVVTDKLHSVLKRFQKEEKAVCERSTSFTKFTSNYRTIIEEYCISLSKRINEWFECKRRKFEKREEKLKQEYTVCCNFMENEKQTMRNKVNMINEKIDQYEKYIEWQMKFIHNKYIPDSKQCTPEAGATRSEKTEWSDILEEPNCTSNIRREIEDYNYKNRYIKPRPQSSLDNCHQPSTKTLYTRNKYRSSKPKRRSRSPSPACSDRASADHLAYTLSQEQTCGFPFQDKLHGEEKTHGKYSIMNKIKEYFDKGHKKPKDYPERTLSVMTLNSDDSECTMV